MRIHLFKIAEHLGFGKSRKLLTYLPDDISQYMTREKWDAFLQNMEKCKRKHINTLFGQKPQPLKHPSLPYKCDRHGLHVIKGTNLSN